MSEFNNREGGYSRRPFNSDGQPQRREGDARPRFSRPRRYDNAPDNRDGFYGQPQNDRRTGFSPRRQEGEGTVDNSQRQQRPRFRVQRNEGFQPRERRPYDREQPRQYDREQPRRDGERRSYSSERPAYDGERRTGGYNRQGGSFAPRRQGDRSATSSRNSVYSRKKQYEYRQQNEDPTKPIRLNKFLANAGFCSRREADDFILAGVVTVNGQVVSTLGTKVLPTDDVMFNSQHVRRERKVYILLNKPKDTVTTSDDPQGRMTVLDIVGRACPERIYPVGRLDRNTTGVLLLTNDGDLAAKLTHPKFEKKKVYAATLDRDLTEDDEDQLRQGVMLDDELIVPDGLEFTKDDRRHLGLEIHSGQNRVVRRIFEKLGYKVMQLDRVSFAGLTKKNLPRGKFRFLTPKEVSMLQMGAF